jgi:hypothetical protein
VRRAEETGGPRGDTPREQARRHSNGIDAGGLQKISGKARWDGMENQVPSLSPLNTIPADVLEMLGPPPLLPAEDEKLHFTIVATIARPIRSPDIVTWMLIKDLADHRFEIARYRRLKTRLIQSAAGQERARCQGELPEAERPERPESEARTHASLVVALRGVHGNDPRFAALVDQEVREERERNAALEPTQDRIEAPEARPLKDDDFAGVFGNWIDDVERIDLLLRASEQRFTQALREIERHIFGFGRLLRDDRDRLIDGEVIGGPEPHIRAISQKDQ